MKEAIAALIEKWGFQKVADEIANHVLAPVPELTPRQIASLWKREKWRNRKNRFETPPAFIKRVYGDLLGRGLIMADFRRRHPETGEMVDADLYQQLMNWLQKNKMPPDIDLPSKWEKTRREAAAFSTSDKRKPNPSLARANLARARRIARLAGL